MVVITGDSDLIQTIIMLKNAGTNVQIWSGSKEINERIIELVGYENIVILDNICDL